MTNPVGRMVGNTLEVEEALDCLQGGGPKETNNLTEVLGQLCLCTIVLN